MGLIKDIVQIATSVLAGPEGGIDHQCTTQHGTATVYQAESAFTQQSLVIEDPKGDTLHMSNRSHGLPYGSRDLAATVFCQNGTLPTLSKDWETKTGRLTSEREIVGPGGNFKVESNFFSGHKTTVNFPNGDKLQSSALKPTDVFSMAIKEPRETSISDVPVVRHLQDNRTAYVTPGP